MEATCKAAQPKEPLRSHYDVVDYVRKRHAALPLKGMLFNVGKQTAGGLCSDQHNS